MSADELLLGEPTPLDKDGPDQPAPAKTAQPPRPPVPREGEEVDGL